MIEYLLAFAFLNELREEAPSLIAAVTTHEACIAEANKRNQTDERLKSPAIRARGGEYICLKIVRGGA